MNKEKRTLPNGWKWVKTVDVLDKSVKFPIRMGPFGSQLTIDELVSEGVFVLGIEHVINKRFKDTGYKFITENKFEVLKGFEVRPGDVLMTMMGTIGRTAVVPEGIQKSIISSHLLKLSLSKDIYPKYIALVLSYASPVYRQLDLASQGAIMQGLNTDIVKKLFFPLPPTIDEQIKIAEELERKLEEVQRMKEAAIKEREAIIALRGALFRSSLPYKEDHMLPDGWRWEKLKAISNKIQYGISRSSSPNMIGPKLLRITDIQEGKVNWDSVPHCECSGDEIRAYSLQGGDILFTRTGATTGKSFLVDNPNDSVFASYLIRVQCNKKIVQPDYLYMVFQSPGYWASIYKGARGGTLAGFNATMLSKLRIPVPRKEDDQIRIADILKKDLEELEKMNQAAGKKFQAIEAMQGAVLREVFDFHEVRN